MSFRIHLLALPNCPVTKEYTLDGFAMNVRRFATMMKNLGHTVFLYGCDHTDAPCDEFIPVITAEEAQTLLGFWGCQYQHAKIAQESPLWQLSNPRIIREIAKRKQPHDFICQIGGTSQEPVGKAHPDLMTVEYSIGYTGHYSNYRVFESTAWRHYGYGAQKFEQGRFFDAVIPLAFDPSEYPFGKQKEPFLLFVGRLIEHKGLKIACAAAKAANVPLLVIGHGGDLANISPEARYLGALDEKSRNNLMARASAVMCPTVYVEPFCAVGVEAQLCGTPVISTDFGGFTETVEHGKTGFRCTYLGDFVDAIRSVGTLDPEYIRDRAVRLYSMETVQFQYQQYFERLMLLWDKGFDTIHPERAMDDLSISR